MNRAYAVLSAKEFDDDARTFTGIATTPSPDRMQDTIDPMGALFKNPLVLLHQHKHDAPVGQVVFGKPTVKGIPFTATMPKIEEPGALRDRVETAWGEIKHGLVRAVSIGFRPLKYAYREDGGIDFQETEILELSTVSVPANAEAVITAVKSLDAAARRAAGVPEPEIPAPSAPAASGKSVPVVRLDTPARDGAQPFVIRKIHRTA